MRDFINVLHGATDKDKLHMFSQFAWYDHITNAPMDVSLAKENILESHAFSMSFT